MDEEKPPARRLVLKPREVVPTEERSLPGDGTAISVGLIHSQNKVAEAKAAAAVRPDPEPEAAQDPDAIKVHDMLRQNLMAAADPKSELIAMPARRGSRRNRDFALVMGVAIAAMGLLALVSRGDPRVMALALVGIGTLALVLAWIIYFVMDRY